MPELTPDAVLASMQPIFEDILDEPDLEINRDSSAQNLPNWDSLAHVEIMETVQRRFKVKFSLIELQGLKTVGDLVDLVIVRSAK
jgi:acyl carrier protein